MREKRDFSLRRNAKPITPEKLMRILNQTEGGERAAEAYRNLTGEEPPEEPDIVSDCPKWKCDNDGDCEHCEWIKAYTKLMRGGMKGADNVRRGI